MKHCWWLALLFVLGASLPAAAQTEFRLGPFLALGHSFNSFPDRLDNGSLDRLISPALSLGVWGSISRSGPWRMVPSLSLELHSQWIREVPPYVDNWRQANLTIPSIVAMPNFGVQYHRFLKTTERTAYFAGGGLGIGFKAKSYIGIVEATFSDSTGNSAYIHNETLFPGGAFPRLLLTAGLQRKRQRGTMLQIQVSGAIGIKPVLKTEHNQIVVNGTDIVSDDWAVLINRGSNITLGIGYWLKPRSK